MNHIHPHLLEEIEYQEGDHPNSAAYDRREAQMGAAYNENTEDEWLLTSRDVWVSNPYYYGPKDSPHPEIEWDDDQYNDWYKREAIWHSQNDQADAMVRRS